jgi:ribosomal protein S18 acetylase RimI-like enzyme
MTELLFRETQVGDVDALFSVRARTRENSFSKEQLASLGITPQSSSTDLKSGRVTGWVCLHGPNLVGFCNGDGKTGEVLVLAVLPEYERRGVGKRLLSHTTESLRSLGLRRIWLVASSDPAARAFGFYRSLGWKPTGEMLKNGDQILVLESESQPIP